MKPRKKKWHECNVAQAGNTAACLWQFHISDRHYALKSEIAETAGNSLPRKAAGKTWRQLLRQRLNIAWLPENCAFLRVIQMPECEAEELRQMLEFQLEKVSPFPISQIVWSYETLPAAEAGQQTVLILLAEASAVETHLDTLEHAGYQPDRLEAPWCHELLALDRSADQLWIRLEQQGENIIALTAWILGQTLRHVALAQLPDTEAGRQSLIEQLDRAAWTGEMEGWLSSIPPATLCCSPEGAGRWSAVLQSWSARPVQTQAAPPPAELAALSARRAARGESQANLLPETRRIRYRQQYIDGMWMKGGGVLALLYTFIILSYFVMLEWVKGDNRNLQAQVRATALQYTNVLKTQARVNLLQEQMDLKFSALECLRTVSEKLPAELTLTLFRFDKGRTLQLRGTAPTGQSLKVTAYQRDLLNAQVGEDKLFQDVKVTEIGDASGSWVFECTLARTDS